MSSTKFNDPKKYLAGEQIGARLRAERLRLGINQKEMALKLGFKTAAAVSNYEKGQVPNPEILTRYAEACGKSREWFLSGEEGAGTAVDPPDPYGGLSRRDRAMRAMLDELLASDDPEILDHLRRQLTLLNKLAKKNK